MGGGPLLTAGSRSHGGTVARWHAFSKQITGFRNVR